jgi:murein DD-endopeptidase MepM/ murein hydrolase activator NlpD
MRGASFLFLILTIAACTLPEASLRQNGWGYDRTISGDSLILELQNPVPAPARFTVRSTWPDVDSLLEGVAFQVLSPDETRRIGILLAPRDTTGLLESIRLEVAFGSLAVAFSPDTLALPFPVRRWYRVIQGYEGSYSHSSDYARFALDFALAVGDTVTAAHDGRVAGVIDGYDVGGADPKYRPYANYITLYHPQNGLFTQYVHLQAGGSMVSVGDSVSKHQPIALVGLTGFTDRAHLHFNVLRPDSTKDLVSVPTTFEGGMAGERLGAQERAEHRH